MIKLIKVKTEKSVFAINNCLAIIEINNMLPNWHFSTRILRASLFKDDLFLNYLNSSQLLSPHILTAWYFDDCVLFNEIDELNNLYSWMLSTLEIKQFYEWNYRFRYRPSKFTQSTWTMVFNGWAMGSTAGQWPDTKLYHSSLYFC